MSKAINEAARASEVTLADAEFLYELGKRREALLGQISEALKKNDTPEVVRLAKLLCGVEQEKRGR